MCNAREPLPPTLAYMVQVPGGRAFLHKFHRVHERETGEYLQTCISNEVQSLRDMGLIVSAVIADNAMNMQKGIRLSSNMGQGFVVANCWAHTLNLFLEDLAKLFDGQWKQMAAVEEFFRIR